MKTSVKRNVSKAVAAALVASTAAFSFAGVAEAGPRHWQSRTVIHHYHHPRPVYRHDNSGGALAIGLAAGVLGAAILSAPGALPAPSATYVGPVYGPPAYPDYYVASRPAEEPYYNARTGEWVGSSEWLAYCHDRYRTFDPVSGTFMHESGVRMMCQ